MPLKRHASSLIGRSIAAAAIAVSVLWAFGFQQGQIGSTIRIENGVAHVSAGASPQTILMSLIGLAAYCILLNTPITQQEFRVASMRRRVAAFAVDFWFAVFVLGSLFGYLDVWMEGRRTGVFHWQFHRDYLVAADGGSTAAVLIGLIAFVAYFLVPLMRRSQTFGCWIFGLVTVNSDGNITTPSFRAALKRIYAEFRGLCSPLKTFRKIDDQGRTFYDRESGFKVVSL